MCIDMYAATAIGHWPLGHGQSRMRIAMHLATCRCRAFLGHLDAEPSDTHGAGVDAMCRGGLRGARGTQAEDHLCFVGGKSMASICGRVIVVLCFTCCDFRCFKVNVNMFTNIRGCWCDIPLFSKHIEDDDALNNVGGVDELNNTKKRVSTRMYTHYTPIFSGSRAFARVQIPKPWVIVIAVAKAS